MFIAPLRDKLWNLVRYGVQHEAHWSSCDSHVLYGVAKRCVDGAGKLGYSVSEPPENRDQAFYKDWITKATNNLLDAIYKYQVEDGGMTLALPVFEDAADRVKKCRTALADLGSDEPAVRPLEGV